RMADAARGGRASGHRLQHGQAPRSGRGLARRARGRPPLRAAQPARRLEEWQRVDMPSTVVAPTTKSPRDAGTSGGAAQRRYPMSKQHASARERVEPGIWRRGSTHEITSRDAQGKQRRRTVKGGVMAARNELAKEVAKRATGERVSADPRLTLNRAADAWYDE